MKVTFKPTNSVYSFHRLADSHDVARLGPLSFAGAQHAGHNTEDYPADEVQDMAQRIASEFAGSVLFQERNPLTGNRSVKPAPLSKLLRPLVRHTRAKQRSRGAACRLRSCLDPFAN